MQGFKRIFVGGGNYDPPRHDPYDYLKYENFNAEVGLDDGPVAILSGKRGMTADECLAELRDLQEIYGTPDLDFSDEEETDLMRGYNARMDRFKNSLPEDLFIAFHEDCKVLEKPAICLDRQAAASPNNSDWGLFHDEWNVLGNWSENSPDFHEVWNRLKIPWKEAVERIVQMKPLLVPAPVPFSIHPQYKKDIENLLEKVVEVDMVNGPYQLVTEQKELATALDCAYSILACKKMMLLFGGIDPTIVCLSHDCLQISYCDYDDWRGLYAFLKQHCKIGEWNGDYGKFPVAEFDLSADPDFSQAAKKTYSIRVQYYDSHAGGW